MKLVLDTDILVAGLRSRTGASRQLLRWLPELRYQAIVNVAMMLEYEAVLKRPDNLRSARMGLNDVERFLDSMSHLVVPARSYFFWRPQLRDPADEHVLEAAVNGGVDGIVTFNHRHLREPAARFGLETLKPGEAVWRIKTWQP
jgi:predicted nucleic acid-binding protein